MNIWLLPLLGLSAIAILAGITLSRREDRRREEAWARHYTPPEPVLTCRAIQEAEDVLRAVQQQGGTL